MIQKASLNTFSVFMGFYTLLSGVLPVFAQVELDREQTDVPDFQTYVPRVKSARISQEDAPKIDGDITDKAWQLATPITDFYQVEPSVGIPSVETKVYFAYDDRNLYVAVHAFDDEPDKILKTILQRDGDVWRDDMLRVYIDPFDTGISGFGFDVNALGARADRLVQANRRPVDEWDTIWDSAGQVVQDGWTAEIAIPFQSISFDLETDGWGLMLTRERSHKNQEIRWAGIDPSVNKFGFARAGRLEGITNVKQGLGLQIDLSGTARVSREWSNPRDDEITLDPSLNILYKFTPSLSGLLTFNSDFSDTPLDNREINTSRFSLFRPETRDFFLQDAAFFEFGGQAFNANSNGRPFFSRRIGIVNGQSATLEAGAKLSGEFNGIEVGVLSARMGEVGSISEQTLSVARVATDLAPHSRIGAIVTNGDPTGLTENTVSGLDYLYQTASFLGGGRLQADLYYQRSFSSLFEDDDSYGTRIVYPNDKWNWSIAARHVGETFKPALGFVNRSATRDYNGELARRFRQSDGPLRWWQVGGELAYITDLSGSLETRETLIELSAQTQQTDNWAVSVFENYERITRAFNLPTDLVVPEGEYQNDGFEVHFTGSQVRAYSGNFSYEEKDFFGGDSKHVTVELNARPNPYLDVAISYSQQDISVPDGDVSVQISSLDTVLNLSPEISVSTQSQYDNISNGLSFFARLRWEIRPETEMFVSLGHGALIDDNDFGRNFRSLETQAVFRLGNSFRF